MPSSESHLQRHVLAINPFHGGSHRQFLEGMVGCSRHHWDILAGKPVHWKWRMRAAPLEMSRHAVEMVKKNGYPDIIFCTDMLDLPLWRGLTRDTRLHETPAILYFHENQWTYPIAPSARPDTHFGYTNLQSAIAADECWFNSDFHRRDFLAASEAFIRRMPDTRSDHDFDRLSKKSKVIYPGFSCLSATEQAVKKTSILSSDREVPETPRDGGPLKIGWVSRWEHDKRPDLFVELMDRLAESNLFFELILLGPRPRSGSEALRKITQKHRGRIVYNGFAENRFVYESWLNRMDLVISTAEHEFFGIAVCEAIWAGAVPVLPDRLSYPELAPSECLYRDMDEAESLVRRLEDAELRRKKSVDCRRKIKLLKLPHITKQIDCRIDQLVELPRCN